MIMKKHIIAGMLLATGLAQAGNPVEKPPVVSRPAVSSAERSKPNIILILADDLGYGDLCAGRSSIRQCQPCGFL